MHGLGNCKANLKESACGWCVCTKYVTRLENMEEWQETMGRWLTVTLRCLKGEGAFLFQLKTKTRSGREQYDLLSALKYFPTD